MTTGRPARRPAEGEFSAVPEGMDPVASPAAHQQPEANPFGDEQLSEIDLLHRERDEYLDSLRRLQADFDNYRKRVQRDADHATDRATEKLVFRLLPVLDHFELALGHVDDPDAGSLAKLHDTLLGTLEAEGLERISPIGEPFDPADAEAVAHEPGDGRGPIVADVLRAGYRWKGRVIRAAMVRVIG